MNRKRWLIGVLALALCAGLAFAFWPRADTQDAELPSVQSPQNDTPASSVKYNDSTRRLLILQSVTATTSPQSSKVLHQVKPLTTWSKGRNALLVLGAANHDGSTYYQVLLPVKPNGTTGWIKDDPAKVHMSRQKQLIRVSLKNRTLLLLENNKVIKTYHVVVGARTSPTPLGLFAVQDAFRTHDKQFTGTRMLVMTGHSEKLSSFDGGPARLAIHGRGLASLKDPLGSARSNGCVRMNNADIEELAQLVNVGTGVVIT